MPRKPQGKKVRIHRTPGQEKADKLRKIQRERGTSGRTRIVKDDRGKITGRD